MPKGEPLIVPIRVDAMCVSDEDATSRSEHRFAARTGNFSLLPSPDDSLNNRPSRANVADEKVISAPFDSDRWSGGLLYGRGIHLHWALPDALTHGSTSFRVTEETLNRLCENNVPELDKIATLTGLYRNADEFERELAKLNEPELLKTYGPLIQRHAMQITFPVVPNRWLVVRLMPERPATAWVVESDYLATEEPKRRFLVTVPIRTWEIDAGANGTADRAASKAQPVKYKSNPGRRQPFRYLGRVVPVAEYSSDQEQNGVERFEKLTAVGYGQPHFAAYYPDCNSVFGFYDDFSDLDGVPQSSSAQASRCDKLCYLVVGWYSREEDEPFSALSVQNDAGKTLERLKWTLLPPDKDARKAPPVLPAGSSCLLHGVVLNINWDPAREDGYIRNQDPGKTTAAIGNTAAEALSSLIVNTICANSKELQEGGTADSVEMVLNALQAGLGKLMLESDCAIKIARGLHASSFLGENAGTLWTIVPRQDRSQTPGAADTMRLLPSWAGTLLNQLNQQQQKCDALEDEIAAMRWQVFSDWFQYMQVNYSSPAEFLQLMGSDGKPKTERVLLNNISRGAEKIAELQAERKQLLLQLAGLDKKLAEAAEAINAKRQPLQPQFPGYELKPLRSPGYWRPSEPVVLLEGDLVKPSVRYGSDGDFRNDGFLTVRTAQTPGSAGDAGVTIPADPARTEIVNRLILEAQLLAKLSIDGSQDSAKFPMLSPLAINRWTGNPWHPFMLRWSAEFERNPGEFELDTDGIDLTQTGSGTAGPAGTSHSYSGSCILTPGAVRTLRSKASDLLRDFGEDRLKPMIELLEDKPILCQSLGGFNDALLQRNLQTQLEILDVGNIRPHPGHPHTPYLDDQVRAFVGHENTAAPLPDFEFNPLRAGFLRLSKLWIVDSFGQYVELPQPAPLVASRLRPAGDAGAGLKTAAAYLAPRLVQPSRLLFRWLSSAGATGDPGEMNPDPACTPVCGWLLINHLDESFMFYDKDGAAIGSLNKQGKWLTAPGRPSAKVDGTDVETVWAAGQDPTLLRFFEALRQSTPGFLDNLLSTVESAFATIWRPNPQRSQATALLISRPLAIVRASLRLDIKGTPAYEQDWTSFAKYVAQQFDAQQKLPPDARNGVPISRGRSVGQLNQLRVPVLLGDAALFEDGLVGYFLDDGTAFGTFYAPAAPLDNHSRCPAILNPRAPQAAPLTLGPAETSAKMVCMLIDPHFPVHAATGLLPVKAIDIPADHIAPALKKIEVTFLAGPVLRRKTQPAAAPALPLPQEPGYEWSWVEPGTSGFQTLTPIKDSRSDAAALAAPLQIADGFLKLTPKPDGGS